MKKLIAFCLVLLTSSVHAELATQTSFKNEVTAYTYDALGRETKRVYGDGQQVITTYTPAGQVMTVTDARGITTYSYDDRDRVIRIDYPGGLFVAYGYDANGNRTALITPTGTTTFGYDDNSRLVTVTDPDGKLTTYVWDEAGHQIEQHLPNGVGTYRVYDDNGRLSEVRHEKGGVVLAKFTYERDDDGRRTGATEQQLDPATQTLATRTLAWSYDELGRLTSETLTEGGHTTKTEWTHDEVGNRLSETRFTDGVRQSTDRYSYDGNDRLTRTWTENGAGQTFSETTYTYDANGATTKVERTGGFVRTYSYDAAQRLTQVQDSSGQKITYGYDAQGNRVAKAVQQAPQQDANGSWRYLLDPLAPFTQVVTSLTDSGSTSAEADYRFGAARVGEFKAGQVLYYGEDGHHSVRLVTDAQGNVVAHLNYEAFGERESSVTDNGNGSSPASPEFQYTGEQYDAALGEYYLRARTYEPRLGRFIRRDSWQGRIVRPISLNAYIYSDADPIGGRDPSGNTTLVELRSSNNMAGILFTAAVRVVAHASTACVATLAVSTTPLGQAAQIPGPLGNCEANVMRVQFQVSPSSGGVTLHTHALPVLGLPGIGVTTTMVERTMVNLFDTLPGWWPSSIEPQTIGMMARTSIGIRRFPPNGISGHVPVWNENLTHNRLQYRIDIENKRGRNLRR